MNQPSKLSPFVGGMLRKDRFLRARRAPVLLLPYQYQLQGEILFTVKPQAVGRDWLLFLCGGSPHIGACALGFPHGHAMLMVHDGHREGDVAQKIASTIAPLVKAVVCVIAGIHFDAISKEKINNILNGINIYLDYIKQQHSIRR